MKTHKVLRDLTDLVKTYEPKHWTFDSGKYAYFDAETHREFHDLSDAFDALTSTRPKLYDTGEQCINVWVWHGWEVHLAVHKDAPTGDEATA